MPPIGRYGVPFWMTTPEPTFGQILRDAATASPILRSLRIRACHARLRQYVAHNGYDIIISLESKDIDDEALTILLEILSEYTNIVGLSLANNKMTDISAPAIAKAILNMPTLKEVNLSNNTFGNHGAEVFADMLLKSGVLKKFELDGNFDEKALQHFVNVAPHNTSLTQLKVASPNADVQKALADAMKHPDRLRSMDPMWYANLGQALAEDTPLPAVMADIVIACFTPVPALVFDAKCSFKTYAHTDRLAKEDADIEMTPAQSPTPPAF